MKIASFARNGAPSYGVVLKDRIADPAPIACEAGGALREALSRGSSRSPRPVRGSPYRARNEQGAA